MSKLPGLAQIVEISTASPEKKKRFLEILAPLSKHTFDNEPETTTFYWMEPVEGDSLTVHALEIYGSRQLKQEHMQTRAFNTFFSAVESDQIVRKPSVLELADPVAGFIVRPNAPNHGNYPDAFIWAGKFVTEPGKADEVIEALKENLPYIESSEPETISFLIFKGIDEEDTVYVWERYTSETALRDVHHKSAGYARLREKTGPLMKSRTIHGYKQVAGFLTKEGGLV